MSSESAVGGQAGEVQTWPRISSGPRRCIRAAGPGGADGAPSAGWGTWAWSSSACPSSSPASSSLASSCSPASCSCTTSTSPSCSSPTWSTSPCLAPAAPAGLTGAPAPASEEGGLWSWLVGVGRGEVVQLLLHLEPAQRRASLGGEGGWWDSDGGPRVVGRPWPWPHLQI